MSGDVGERAVAIVAEEPAFDDQIVISIAIKVGPETLCPKRRFIAGSQAGRLGDILEHPLPRVAIEPCSRTAIVDQQIKIAVEVIVAHIDATRIRDEGLALVPVVVEETVFNTGLVGQFDEQRSWRLDPLETLNASIDDPACLPGDIITQ